MIRTLDPLTGHMLYYDKRPTTLYYVRFEPVGRDPVYKIGITVQDVAKRFRSERIPYTVLHTELLTGKEAYYKEQRILSQYERWALPYEELLTSGNSELFSVDIRQFMNKGEL